MAFLQSYYRGSACGVNSSMSGGCEIYERLEQRLIEIRSKRNQAALSGIPLTDAEEAHWLRLELKALRTLQDHAAEHGC